jgi:alginate O-acetyltransferase complex protein AlgI
MVFSSSLFLFYFLPVFLLCYFAVPTRFRNGVLLLFSVLFYGWGAPVFLMWLLANGFTGHLLVQAMHRATTTRVKQAWLTAFVGMHLALLGWFKYANFFVDNLSALSEWWGGAPWAWNDVVLPVGISFFAFQAITYGVDVYRGVDPPVRRWTDYLMYLLMFPQLIAGPIVRFRDVAQSIRNREHTAQNFHLGMVRFSIGLSKKMLLANPLGEQVDVLLGNQGMAGAPDAWMALTCYTLQIFFDFSGYSDMAIGLGKMMGFTFPENFDQPYRATSITSFWQRWHITLGAFMREYLYIPLGGNRRGAVRTYQNLLVVFFLSGLWHGAQWTFVAWGLYHGLWLMVERMAGINASERALWRVPLTLLVVMLGWVLFRAADGAAAWQWYQALVTPPGSTSLWLPATVPLVVVGAVVALWPKGQVVVRSLPLQWLGAALLLVLSATAIAGSGFNPFIYFRF